MDKKKKPQKQARRRVVIENVKPQIDCGRFPAKRVTGEKVVVEADVFTDGHDLLFSQLLFRADDEQEWTPVPMEPLVNDRWRGSFEVLQLGFYHYTLEAWLDPFKTWARDLTKKIQAGQDVGVDCLIGAALIEQAAGRADGEDRKRLNGFAQRLRKRGLQAASLVASNPELEALMARYPDRSDQTVYPKQLKVFVENQRAAFSTWYELFPRSCPSRQGDHGSFRDCETELERIKSMGFDVLYLPPIHPIGQTHRKGKNNAPVAEPDDTGSPWAIGSKEGGHKSVHPSLGTLEDFRRLVAKARQMGIETALDIAFQCSPDHPYVQEHPEWFRGRPDGSIQYAENPPKKYEDIYPFDFETKQWRELWEELKSIFLFWIEQGVRIFRVDNPHTKPFRFWEWLIWEIKLEFPDIIFLSEAFTRPKVMYRLAKLGFTQSYTYFAWRNASWELKDYFTELTKSDVREFFRPNLWPNTPDILTEHLQTGGRPAFMARLVLAATLGASYGIYGPAYELLEDRPRHPGSEEYLDSEKYQLRDWDLHNRPNLIEFITLVNRIRQENPALHSDRNLFFHQVDNPQLLCYSKHTDDYSNLIVTVVNLDPHHRQTGWFEIPTAEYQIAEGPFQAHDLLSGARYIFGGAWNYVELDPHVVPAHVFRIRRRIRTEHDFEYFL
jgi:starch synthase (maltosyl-transferring)